MRIEFLNDKFIFYRLYPLAYYERQQLENIIADLKTSDVVKDCNSPFGNSVLLVQKTNRKIRLYGNYRRIDKAMADYSLD